MKTVGFRFNLEEKVNDVEKGFSGVITMCSIKGTRDEPEKIYLVEGGGDVRWVAENNLKEAE